MQTIPDGNNVPNVKNKFVGSTELIHMPGFTLILPFIHPPSNCSALVSIWLSILLLCTSLKPGHIFVCQVTYLPLELLTLHCREWIDKGLKKVFKWVQVKEVIKGLVYLYHNLTYSSQNNSSILTKVKPPCAVVLGHPMINLIYVCQRVASLGIRLA